MKPARTPRPLLFVLLAATALGASACKDDKPCNAGMVFDDGVCFDIKPDASATPTPTPDTGAGPTFGTICHTTDHSDCQSETVDVCLKFPTSPDGVCSRKDCDKSGAPACPANSPCTDLSVFQPGAPHACLNAAWLSATP